MTFSIGVDVGTGSVRACLVNIDGELLSLAELPIKRQELIPNYITQSSEEIWGAVCLCVKKVVQESGVPVDDVTGLGFDATCSLVAVDDNKGSEPIAVGPAFEDSTQNIILWMDHRAVLEADRINATGDPCLKYVGGQMSVEMELPKIKWLQNNLPPQVFARCQFFDLPDYLTFRATGKSVRSFCSTVCKQGLLSAKAEPTITGGWSKKFFCDIGLDQIAENGFKALGGPLTNDSTNNSLPLLTAGECVGQLSSIAASELGLSTRCAVGSGIIDAYAGWIGTIAASTDDTPQDNKQGISSTIGRLAAIAGTSTCHITISEKAIFVPGIWGPFSDVISKGYWCTEGGQSCTGELLSHIIKTHPAYKELELQSSKAKINMFEYLNQKLLNLAVSRNERSVLFLAKHLFLYGDFHGNRSPIADPAMRGAIIGQSMDTSLNDLAVLYLGACEFIAHQTRQIIETMVAAGHHINSIYISGGQSQNQVLMELLANSTGLRVILPRYTHASVVFGSAILGAVARETAQNHHTHSKILWEQMVKMTPKGTVVEPVPINHPDRVLLQAKYKIYLNMIETQRDYRNQIDHVEQLLATKCQHNTADRAAMASGTPPAN